MKVVVSIFGLLREARVSLKSKKCVLFRRLADYLGHKVVPGKLSAAARSTERNPTNLLPDDCTNIRSLLGA